MTTSVVATPRKWRPASFDTQVLVLTARVLRTSFADVKLTVLGLAQPVILLLLFSQVFAGVGALPGIADYGGYVNFLVPATLVNIALTVAIGSGAGLLTEMYNGVLGRFRVLPISMLAVLTARTLGDVVRLGAQLVIVEIAAVLLLGFRPVGGILGLAAATGLCLVAGWGLSWVFVALCAWARKPETLQAVGFIAIFPLMFSSTAYMPASTLPDWLRLVAAVNPLTYTIEATRALVLARPLGWSLVVAVGLAVAIGAFGAAASARAMSSEVRG